MRIVMTDDEVSLLKRFLRHASSYFEFGMGGSTYLASQVIGGRITAVDSDAGWVSKVSKEIGASSKQVDLRHIDIGPTGKWGNPVGTGNEHLFPAYSKSILFAPADTDLCLVDGRFRVSCFLTALHHLRSDSIIGIHDYAMRSHYRAVEEFARPIASANQLYFFIRRAGADLNAVAAAAEKFRKDFR